MDEPTSHRGGVYRVLDHPFVYRLNRLIVAPGAVRDLRRAVRRFVEQSPHAHAVLDVACGPESWLEAAGIDPIGADLAEGYLRHFVARGRRGVVAAADALPFADEAFDAVWSFALLHHLSDAAARRTVRQMLRVCRPGGTVAVIDGVYPDRAWRHPFAFAVRAADRGRHMRTAQQLIDLLPDGNWRCERFSVGLTRLPFLGCLVQK